MWDVVSRWYYELGQGSIVMTWRDPSAVGEQRIRTLGEAPKDIVDADGVYLVKYRQLLNITPQGVPPQARGAGCTHIQ